MKLQLFREYPSEILDTPSFQRMQLALPDEVERWSPSTLREKAVKIGANVTAHARCTVFLMAEAAAPHELFGRILEMIGELRPTQAARC